MTARAFTGLRVVLVAAFNRRYHRSGLALAAALEGLGCEVRRCEERRRGWNALLGRSLATRLAACLRAGPVEIGRASCRERVEIAVGGVALKKTKDGRV